MIGNSSMEHVAKLKCLICGKEYDADDINYVCPDHGNEGIVDVQYDYDQIARRISQGDLLHSTDHTIWRYKPLLPVEPDATVPPLTVGWTPLYRTDRLAAELGLNHLWIKDDGRLPTASFKDRASAVAIVKSPGKASRDDCGSQHR
jgi:threonine synthase